jgi:hypothetical protein
MSESLSQLCASSLADETANFVRFQGCVSIIPTVRWLSGRIDGSIAVNCKIGAALVIDYGQMSEQGALTDRAIARLQWTNDRLRSRPPHAPLRPPSTCVSWILATAWIVRG